jgi:RNA-binding protein PNO1
MVAPTAAKFTQTAITASPNAGAVAQIPNEAEILIDTNIDGIQEDQNDNNELPQALGRPPSAGLVLDETGKPKFQSQADAGKKVKLETRKVPIPPHRMSPLKAAWPKIYPPLVEYLKLQVRMNLKSRAVELRSCKKTTDPGALQKGADFIKAFSLGFDIDDAIALLRLDDLYIESFEIKDVKTLHGDHLSRAIGRIAGKDGRTKFAIENATRTRIVLADSKIHILGGFTHIKMAREAVMSLILGSPPGKVYGNLRTIASRLKERY